ncbi:hypothetical protein EYF80_067103 [Liparis tanakae]|uniref:Uncharacterized protein n=1 Tax=Liparis tanakae TaxID=230148 RepID=A0A4Z2E1Z0_9TELE|nr:hypothetical protein EYF80_067103 [Liparis tanakae]
MERLDFHLRLLQVDTRRSVSGRSASHGDEALSAPLRKHNSPPPLSVLWPRFTARLEQQRTTDAARKRNVTMNHGSTTRGV